MNSKTENIPPSWPGRKIILEKIEELDSLLTNGYEIKDRYFHLVSHRNDNGEFENTVTSRLLLEKDQDVIHATTDSLGLYPMQFERLYDFEKKRPVFTFMPDQSIHTELETIIVDIIAPRFKKYVKTVEHSFNNAKKIYQIMQEFVKSEKELRYVGYPKLHLSDIFSKVLIINENQNSIDFDIVSKEKITLKEIQEIQIKSKIYDNCIALSFFYLTKKISKNDFNDVLVGLVLYDIKNAKTLCFRIVSSSYFYQFQPRNRDIGRYDVALSIFEECIQPNMVCKWYLPSLIDHPWYTPMPWIHYSVLLPIKNNTDLENIDKEKQLSIPEYFVFGIPKWPAKSDNFVFEHFASFREGRATILFDFNSDKRITYPLRFDQSKGESLVHLDFAFYDGKQHKLIAHRPLDLESVSAFSLPLYGSILAAGFFDGFFSTIIRKGVKGVEELRRKNPAYLYPLKIMWEVETAIIWLKENGGFDILQKIYDEKPLTEKDITHLEKTKNEHLFIAATDKNGKNWGLTPIGHIVIHRYLSGQTNLNLNSE